MLIDADATTRPQPNVALRLIGSCSPKLPRSMSAPIRASSAKPRIGGDVADQPSRAGTDRDAGEQHGDLGAREGRANADRALHGDAHDADPDRERQNVQPYREGDRADTHGRRRCEWGEAGGRKRR